MISRAQEWSQKGFALVIVLWAVAMLSLIAISVVSSGSLSLHLERNALTETRGAFLLEAAINRVMLGLADARPEKRFRSDGADQAIAFGENVVHVWIQNTSGLIDINEASSSLLASVFVSAGLSDGEANELAKRVIDWRSIRAPNEDAASGDERYTVSRRTYRPRHGPFQSLDELNLVLGMTPALFAQISPDLTIYSHQSDFDPTLAPRLVLLTVPGANEEQVDQMLAARQLDQAGQVAGIFTNGSTYRIAAELTIGSRSLKKSAVVRLTDDRRAPFSILDWN